MKKLLPAYITIAIVWAILATVFGVNSIPGAGVAHNLGRNLPRAAIWPWYVVKSPYTLFQWITTPGIRAELQPLYDACLVRTRDHDACGCAVRALQSQITDADAKAFEDAARKGVEVEPRLAMLAVKAKAQCR